MTQSGAGHDLDSLYQEIILDHYKNPLHAGLREPYEAEVHHVNPTCGDEVTLRVHLTGGADGAVVGDVSYDAEGCSISQAAASVMADLLIGRPLAEASATHEGFVALMQGRGTVEADEELLEDAVAFAGVARFPARVKCALLAWMAWKDATARAYADGLPATSDATNPATPTTPTTPGAASAASTPTREESR